MKNKIISITITILFASLLLSAQYGCKKKVDKYSKFIVGCWREPSDYNIFTHKSAIRFYDDTYGYYHWGQQCDFDTILNGPYPYHINQDTIYLEKGDTLLIDKMKTNLLHQLVMHVRDINGGQLGGTIKYIKCSKCK